MKTSSKPPRSIIHKTKCFALASLAVTVALCIPVTSFAQTDVFKANNTDALNLNTSWSSGAVPSTNDVAVWSNTVTAANNVALGENLSLGGIRIANPGGLVSITNTGGYSLTLGSAGIDMSSATQALLIQTPINLSESQTWSVGSGRYINSTLNANTGALTVSNNGHNLTVTFAASATSTANYVNFGALSGSGNLTLNGQGRIRLNTALTNYTGTITVNGGLLRAAVNNAAALGTSSAALVLNGGTLELASAGNTTYGRNTTVGGSATISNTSSSGTGAFIYNFGTLSIDGNTLTVERNQGGTSTGSVNFEVVALTGNATFNVGANGTNAAAINQLQLGAISDSGSGFGFSKVGTGELVLTNAGTFTGNTTVNNGIVRLAHSSAVQNSTVDLAGVGGSVEFATNVASAAFGGLKGSQNIGLANVSNNAVALNVGGNNQSTTYGGVMSGGGSLTKTGTGTFTLTGTNTYAGATTVSDGTLVVNGAIAGSLTVDSGATLGGSGTIGGEATIAGNLNPGNSPGLLTFSNNLTLASSATTTMEIQGTARGDEYDAVNVTGNLTYGGALVLDFSNPFNQGSYTFDLFSATGGYSDNFVSVSLAGAYSGSFIYDLATTSWNYESAEGDQWTFYQGSGTLEFDAVPEPSTYALLVLAGVGLAAHVIRRRYRRV
jgi:fibronectin-binding autotransporter adhesin